MLNKDTNRLLGLQSGIVIFNPITQQYEIPQNEIDGVIEEAIKKCDRRGIVGKDITPFLLREITDATKGRTLTANVRLIHDNAQAGADIAVGVSSLENPTLFQPATFKSPTVVEKPRDDPTDVMVVGSMAVDLTCTLSNVSSDLIRFHTSHPAKIHTSAGGVAHNVALAAHYASSNSVRLITALGSDPQGDWLRKYVQSVGLDVRFVPGRGETARYVAMHNGSGELLTAAADMRIIESFKEEDIRREINLGKPRSLVFDGNVSANSINAILEECGTETRGSAELVAMLISLI